jgi:tetratricopeptide (TPR) repeat protein
MIGRHIGADRVGAYSPVVFTEILKRTADEERSGALHVVSGPSVKTIHFQDGSVRFAASNIRRDRLGESMLAHEFISKRDYELASEKMKAERCRFGEALLQLGRLTEKDLKRELAIQVQRIVLSLFRIPAGTYSYEADLSPASAALGFGLPVPPLLLKGLRVIEDGKLILSSLPPAETRVRVAARPPYKIDLKKLSPSERMVLEIAGDGAEIGEIIRQCDLGRSAAFRSCFVLLALKVLELVDPDPPVPDETSEQCRNLILEQFARLADVGEADLLGVRADATLEELEDAFQGLEAEWAEVRKQVTDPSLLEKLTTIEFRVASAFTRLRVERDPTDEPDATEARLVEPEPEPEPEPVPQDFARKERMSRLERDARLHLQVKDWSGAVPLLHELVALDPRRAELQTMLGTAMQHVPTLSKNAEQHFLEAVSLAPEDVYFRVDLARFYVASRNHSRALAEIQTVLAADPTNEDAQKLLKAMRSPTRMEKLFKKVFR